MIFRLQFYSITYLETVNQNLRTTNGRFTTGFSQCSAIYISIFYRIEVQTVILRCWTGLNLNWFKSWNTKRKNWNIRECTFHNPHWCFCSYAGIGISYLGNSTYMKVILTKNLTFIIIIYHTKFQFAKNVKNYEKNVIFWISMIFMY